MASYILTPGSYGLQAALGTGEFGIIGSGATVSTTAYATAIAGNDGSSVQVFGNVYSPGTAIGMIGSTVLDIGATGVVAAPYTPAGTSVAVSLEDVTDTVMFNAGAIYGGNTAVSIRGYSGNVQIHNSGLINSADTGVYSNAYASVVLELTNSGTIRANGIAISSDLNGTISNGTTFHVTNTGVIFGGAQAFKIGGAHDFLVNQGEIIGDIMLGGGNDVYNGRKGTVDGVIYGEDGNDRFVVGAGEETIIAGAGNDILDMRTAGAINVALDGSMENSGVAAGDTYSGFEQIWGSNFGKDILIGDGANNTLIGNGGDDRLYGKAGSDVLIGCLGRDTMYGDLGNDTFVYRTVEEGGDAIPDFHNVLGDNDSFRFWASGFSGLQPGALLSAAFQTSASNVAQNVDVRIIFRTGDATLWYDENGSDAGGPRQMADLQAGAVVTFGDIFVI